MVPLPAGHGDYAYQQSSYTEQSYDRSFEESTQHYYEGGKELRGSLRPRLGVTHTHSGGAGLWEARRTERLLMQATHGVPVHDAGGCKGLDWPCWGHRGPNSTIWLG